MKLLLCCGLLLAPVLSAWKLKEAPRKMDSAINSLSEQTMKQKQVSTDLQVPGKVALWMTSHGSPQHVPFIQNYPTIMASQPVLNSADVFLYVGTDATGPPKMVFHQALMKYPNPKKTLHYVHDNPGYQQGAMKGLWFGFQSGWFAGYDWVIKLDPDVVIWNEAELRTLMFDPQASGIFNTCRFVQPRCTTKCLDDIVMTDFFAVRPSAVAGKPLFSDWASAGNAEMSATHWFRDLIFVGADRWLDQLNPDGACRVRGHGLWHDHGEFGPTMANRPWLLVLPAPPGPSVSLTHLGDKMYAWAWLADPAMFVYLFLPVVVCGIGLALVARSGTYVIGLLVTFLGAQALMNLYMKDVLSHIPVMPPVIKGMPAPFAVTAMQQLVGFAVLLLIMGSMRVVGKPIQLSNLENRHQVMSVCAMSVVLALNIGLNNLSLSLLDVSVNLLVRSMAPVVSYVLEALLHALTGERRSAGMSWQSGLAMLVSVMATVAAGISKYGLNTDTHTHTNNFTSGIGLCLLSLVAASAELLLARYMTEHVKLNPVDTVFYMALPTALILIPFACLVPHPVPWPRYESLTDLSVLTMIWEMRKTVILWAMFSGVLSVGYNFLLYNLASNVPAYIVQLTGNFGKLATIAWSIFVAMEGLPQYPWSFVFIGGAVVNSASFAYCQFQSAPKDAKQTNGQNTGSE